VDASNGQVNVHECKLAEHTFHELLPPRSDFGFLSPVDTVEKLAGCDHRQEAILPGKACDERLHVEV
jgi:hypothetical protein